MSEMSPMETSKSRGESAPLPRSLYTGPRNRRKQDHADQLNQSSAWLVSFTDIMALMLTFFVLLYAMSEPEEKVMSEISIALKQELYQQYGPKLFSGPQDTINLGRTNFNRALDLEYLQNLVSKEAQTEDINSIDYIQSGNRLIISMPQTLLFGAGGTEMSEAGRNQLYKLANILSRIRNRIEVVGHSDPAPITNPNSSYPSNWELSLTRAAEVASILTKTGYERPIAVRGYSSNQYENLPASAGEDVRTNVSRRVDIHILEDDGRISDETLLNLE